MNNKINIKDLSRWEAIDTFRFRPEENIDVGWGWYKWFEISPHFTMGIEVESWIDNKDWNLRDWNDSTISTCFDDIDVAIWAIEYAFNARLIFTDKQKEKIQAYRDYGSYCKYRNRISLMESFNTNKRRDDNNKTVWE